MNLEPAPDSVSGVPRLAVLVVVGCLAVLPACGSGSTAGSEGAPAPGDLAGEAVAALLQAESAHYVIEARADFEGEAPLGAPFGFEIEGDASLEAFTGEGSVTFTGATFEGALIAGPHEFFVQLMGRWYGTTEFGLADARKELEASDDEAAELWRDLQTGDGVRKYFDRAFIGEVSEGPELDGQPTWQFEGTLNVDGIWALAEALGEAPADYRAVLEAIAGGTRFNFVVGRDDRLPRTLELTVDLSREDLENLDADDFGEAESLGFLVNVELSAFGEPVDYEAPEDFQPLDQAFESFFGGLG
jgi:hypothetical protein